MLIALGPGPRSSEALGPGLPGPLDKRALLWEVIMFNGLTDLAKVRQAG